MTNTTRQPVPAGTMWTRRGSGTDNWYSFGQYAVTKRGNFWELTYAGELLGYDKYLQLAMQMAALPPTDEADAKRLGEAA